MSFFLAIPVADTSWFFDLMRQADPRVARMHKADLHLTVRHCGHLSEDGARGDLARTPAPPDGLALRLNGLETWNYPGGGRCFVATGRGAENAVAWTWLTEAAYRASGAATPYELTPLAGKRLMVPHVTLGTFPRDMEQELEWAWAPPAIDVTLPLGPVQLWKTTAERGRRFEVVA